MHRCILLPDHVGVQRGLQACVPVAPWVKIHGDFVLASDASTLVQTCVVRLQTESRDCFLHLGRQRAAELSNRC